MTSDATPTGDPHLRLGLNGSASRAGPLDPDEDVRASEPGGSQAPRLYTPEEAAAILSGHPAPFSARAGDVTPGALRAAAHRRKIPFRLWHGKVRFTSEDLGTAVLQSAVAALPRPAEVPVSCVRRTGISHSSRRRTGTAMQAAPDHGQTGTRRQLIAKAPAHGRRPPVGER
jgi:hypothetical protein